MKIDYQQKLKPGPKFICTFSPATATSPKELNGLNIEITSNIIRRIQPSNAPLTNGRFIDNEFFSYGYSDENQSLKGYVHINDAGQIQVGCSIPTGVWGEFDKVWWPGVYEMPLINQANSLYHSLGEILNYQNQILVNAKLTDIGGTSFIATKKGSGEQPISIPIQINSFLFPGIQFKNSEKWEISKLIAAFDGFRKQMGVNPPSQFYLNHYSDHEN